MWNAGDEWYDTLGYIWIFGLASSNLIIASIMSQAANRRIYQV